MIEVGIMLKEGAKAPSYALEGDSGMDLFAYKDVIIPSGETIKVPTGCFFEIPKGSEGQVRPKSGMTLKGLVTELGTIDSNFRGEVQCLVHNKRRDFDQVIKKGTKCGQIVFVPVEEAKTIIKNSLSNSNRGINGFGHTGEK